MANELLPCPFCGGAPSMAHRHDEDDCYWSFIECKCGVRTRGHWVSRRSETCPIHFEEVRDEWNRRAALAAKDAAPCPHIRGEHGSQWCALAESAPEILRQAAQRVVDAWHTKSAAHEAFIVVTTDVAITALGKVLDAGEVVVEAPAGMVIDWAPADEKRLDDAIAGRRAQAAPVAGVPAGWKLVPVELTRKMQEEWNFQAGVFRDRKTLWRCILAAAPQPQGDT